MFMPGEFSVRNTSAGDADPSAANWLASSVSLPLRISTGIPVSWVNACAHAWVRFSCWALYTTSPPVPVPTNSSADVAPDEVAVEPGDRDEESPPDVALAPEPALVLEPVPAPVVGSEP